MTNSFSGRPARILVNRLALGVGPILDLLVHLPAAHGELQQTCAPRLKQQGSTDFTPFWSGQACTDPEGRCPPRR